MESNTLKHWGILGMKWGVRRFQNKDGSLTPAGKTRYDDDSDMSDEYRNTHSERSISSMTNKDIQERINRLNLEKQYTNLSKKEISDGRKFVTSILTEFTKQVASQYINKCASKGIDKVIQSFLNKK